MDPITTAILTTVPALASNLATCAIKDAYAGVKGVIRRRWGSGSGIAL